MNNLIFTFFKMGFGFNFFLIFIGLPFFALLLLLWGVTKSSVLGKALAGFAVFLVGFIFCTVLIRWATAKKELEKADYYGEYVVNRNYFKGKQADWQYNSFRFKIKENDSIYFYVTNKEQIVKIYKGTISTKNVANSARLILKMEQPTHHLLTTPPTTYRGAWDFYLVFNSPKFGNVFFKKQAWKPL
ncbi:hypothetical protein [Hugenholtzia roseola]|uniref:hypothetical protein n=1 Tax=Hugenholtzia roseola TaxID=1002 RepID=UPI00040AD4DD|nr:hypothetical protein [Hugenholtzia roseola]